MLGGIERGEPVDAKQGRKKQRLKAATQRLLPVMHQGTVVARLCTLMALYRLRQPGHHRAKGIVLVEPVRKEMHAHIRQTRRALDKRCARGPRAVCRSVSGIAAISLSISHTALGQYHTCACKPL